jgi:cytochrome c556
MDMWRSISFPLACGLLVCLGGCEAETTPSQSQAQSQPPSQFVLTASIQDIMTAEVDPAADFLWESVGTVVTADGVEERRPRTDEEWQRVRSEAVTLTEAANLLMMDGRRVAEEGKKLEDEGVEGILTAVESQQAIDDARPAFVAFARALHDVGAETLAAIDARDVEGMMKAGEELDAVCESCHVQFWYPGQVIPDVPVF